MVTTVLQALALRVREMALDVDGLGGCLIAGGADLSDDDIGYPGCTIPVVVSAIV